MRKRLSYAGQFIPELVQQSNDENDCISIDNMFSFPDETTPQTLIAQWSQQEFTEIFSALLAGAMVISPDNYINTVDTFSRIIFCMPDLCELIAECIDNPESATSVSLQNFLNRNGYSKNFSDVTDVSPIVTSIESAGNLLPDGFDCNEPNLMAISRGIVRELNETTEDLLQLIELVTNSVELAEIVAQYIPVAGIYVEFAGWLQETFGELYQGSYTDAVEDEISCAIFCAALDECDLSLDSLMQAYFDLSVDVLSWPDTSSALAILTWMTSLPTTLGITIVTAFHWGILALMRFGGGFVGFVGIGDLKGTIKQLAGMTDYSFDDCDCAPAETPTDYWMIRTDFNLGLGQWTLTQGTLQKGGIASTMNGGGVNQAVIQIDDLGASFQVKSAGTIAQRRGATGNGGGDQNRIRAYPAINLGGTPQDISFQSFITCNTNDCDYQEEVFGGGYQPAMSIQCYVRDNGNYNAINNFVKLRELVIYGLCNTGQVKPAMAVYVSSIPAVGNLFD